MGSSVHGILQARVLEWLGKLVSVFWCVERDALLGPDGLAWGSPSGLEYMPSPPTSGAQEGGTGWPFQKRGCIQLTWASISKAWRSEEQAPVAATRVSGFVVLVQSPGRLRLSSLVPSLRACCRGRCEESVFIHCAHMGILTYECSPPCQMTNIQCCRLVSPFLLKDHFHTVSSLLHHFFKISFFILLYNIVLVLPYINLNPP